MLKFFIGSCIFIAAIQFFNRQGSKPADGKESKVSARQSLFGSTLVIKFKDPQDLLAQLRTVRVGQKFELLDVGQRGPMTGSGIRCSDTKAVAAFTERMNREAAQLNRDFEREFKRINQGR